jgi:outer membrane protein OmpA-like peptidoglycan-associated protein
MKNDDLNGLESPRQKSQRRARGVANGLIAAAFIASAGCSTVPVAVAPVPVAITAPAAPVRTTAERAEAIATLKVLGFEPSDEGWLMNFSIQPILFGPGLALLTDAEKVELRRIAGVLLHAGIDGIRIEGHTDNVGNREYNRALSKRRAEAAAVEFVAAGMPAQNVARVGFGSEKPIASNATHQGRAKNRRVVLIIPPMLE